MKGHTDDAQRALIDITVKATPKAESASIQAWIDTAFDGHLVCPLDLIRKLGFKSLGKIEATLADGSVVEPEIYLAYIEWHEVMTPVRVISNDNNTILLGTQLLKNSVLHIDYITKQLEVTQ